MKNEFDYLNGAAIDFSKYEETNLTGKELENMKNVIKNSPDKKRRIRWGAVAGLAACVAVVAAFTQTAFGKELIGAVIKTISTGKNTFYQYDMSNAEVEIPK